MWDSRDDAINAALAHKLFSTWDDANSTYTEVNTIITLADTNATQEDVFINFYNCCEIIRDGGSMIDWATSMGLEEYTIEQEELPF